MENYTLLERARYYPASIGQDELIDLIEELESWRELDLGSPKDAAQHIERLEDNQKED